MWVRDYATAQALDNRAPKEAYVEHRYEYDSAGQLVKRSRSAVIDPHSPDSEHKMSKSTDARTRFRRSIRLFLQVHILSHIPTMPTVTALPQ